MSLLSHLQPAAVWTYFEEICNIPRLSKNEKKIREYLISFAATNKLDVAEDATGNILISRPATEGMENRKTVVLQSHMDMVGEKNSYHQHNWETDPIIPFITSGWVHADGTTLGADDGIGMAVQMAILTDRELSSGRIECLFTVDEESGMTGAINLKPDFFSGQILMNLDSEDEGILYIGCAGGMDTIATVKYDPLTVPTGSVAFQISLTGLHGGHSGDEIHKGYGNAVKILTALLSGLFEKFSISLSSFNGGNLRNAIPREAFAVITSSQIYADAIQQSTDDFFAVMINESGSLEPDVRLEIKPVDLPDNIIPEDSFRNLLEALKCCPHGVISWSKDMDDLVETSSNLASVKFTGENTIRIVTTQRSSVNQAKHEVSGRVRECFSKIGAEVKVSDGYPGWKPDLNSEILTITRNSFVKLFGQEPLVRAIHAGLECGLIFEKNKGIDMISIGPTIRGAHTPEEKIEIESTGRFWVLLKDILQNIPEERSLK